MPHSTAPAGTIPLSQMLTGFITNLPLGSMLIGYAPAAAVAIATPHADSPAPEQVPATVVPPDYSMGGPGCTAADNAGVALYHLDGLAQGKPNFGVLRVSKERLEQGARSAKTIGANTIAEQMLDIAGELPHVHNHQQAQMLAEKLRPVAYAAWDLGARCKGSSLTRDDIEKAREAARRLHAPNGK